MISEAKKQQLAALGPDQPKPSFAVAPVTADFEA
jgi:hypothetical protein